jgi:hypothetical protein
MITEHKALALRFSQVVPNLIIHTFTAPRKQSSGGLPNRFDVGGLPCVVYEWECLDYTLVHLHFNAPLDCEIELYHPTMFSQYTRLYCSDNTPETFWRNIRLPFRGSNVLTWVTITYGGDEQLSVRDADWHLSSRYRSQHGFRWDKTPLPLASMQVKVVK